LLQLQKLEYRILNAEQIVNVMVDFSRMVIPQSCIGLHIRGDRSNDLEGLLLEANLIFGEVEETDFTAKNFNSVTGWEVSIFVSVGKKIIERAMKSTLGGLKNKGFSHLATAFQEVQSRQLEEPFTFSVSLKRFYSEF